MPSGSLHWDLGTERATLMRLFYLPTGISSCRASFKNHEVTSTNKKQII